MASVELPAGRYPARGGTTSCINARKRSSASRSVSPGRMDVISRTKAPSVRFVVKIPFHLPFIGNLPTAFVKPIVDKLLRSVLLNNDAVNRDRSSVQAGGTSHPPPGSKTSGEFGDRARTSQNC